MKRLCQILAFAFSLIALTALPLAVQAQEVVDLELVLAVDSSASVSNAEYRLQMDGIAAAFRDEGVLKAVQSGPLKSIGVALVVWADAEEPKQTSDWFIVSNAQEAETFAQMVERFPRETNGGTGIGAGILHAIDQLRNNHLHAARRVVDVSGDGEESETKSFSQTIEYARRAATEDQITINGLAILTDDENLDEWYWEEVATGLGRFVMAADSFEDFANAMKKKLIQEIQYTPPVVLAD